jgi:hypothetical protein
VAFHETFWVIAGTAAPVIALANVVSIGDSRGLIRQFTALSHDLDDALGDWLYAAAFRRNLALPAWALMASNVNFWVQAFVLCFSLLSVLDRKDMLPPYLATVFLTSGLVAVGQVARIMSDAKNFSRLLLQAEKARSSEPDGGAAQDARET